jgi:hypothetical protein
MQALGKFILIENTTEFIAWLNMQQVPERLTWCNNTIPIFLLTGILPGVTIFSYVKAWRRRISSGFLPR